MKLTRGSIDSISLKLALQEHYETYYKICNHDARYVPPLSLVTMSNKERYDPYGRFRRLTENFITYDIKNLFGYSLTEFLELPRSKISTLMDVASEKKRIATITLTAEEQAAAAAERAIQNQQQ